MNTNLTLPRPIVPKTTNSPIKTINSTPILPSPSFYSSSVQQPIQKNFQCRICHLTYKVILNQQNLKLIVPYL